MYAGVVSGVDPNTEISGRLWYGDVSRTGVAHEMMLDPHVSAAVHGITDPILGADWQVFPKDKDPFANEVADFVAESLFERIDFQAALADSMHYLRDGCALLEITDDVCDIAMDKYPNHPGSGKAICLTGTYGVQRRTVERWIQSKENPRKIAGLMQHLFGSDVELGGREPVNADRLLRFTWMQEGANFDGVPVIRCAYQPWKVRKMYILTGAIQAEREGTGVPIIELPEDYTDDDKEEVADILSGLRSSHKGYIVLPDGFKFRFEAPHGTPVVFEERIAKCNFDIAHGIARLGFLLLGHKGNGSYALASELEGQYALCLRRHANFLEQVWNHGSDGWSPIKRLVWLNYGEAGLRAMPKLRASLPTQDWAAVWPIVKDLVGAGIISKDDALESFARQSLMLPKAENPRAMEEGEIDTTL